MKIDLKNKVALITGAAGTIGSATASALASEGAIIFLNDINEHAGSELAEQLCSENHTSYFIKGDVTNEKDMSSFVDFAISKYGHIDILVNNAGINVGNDGRRPIFDYKPSDWQKVIDVCLDSIFFCSKFTIPSMIMQNCGRIVNIGSVAGFIAPLRLQSPYSAAKAAIINITKSMALDYAKNQITVNAVVPGSILNEQLRNLIYADEDRAKSMMAHIPLGRTGKASDVANAVLYLVSDEASYVTGTSINVDGGWTCGYALDSSKNNCISK